ncbi:MAG: hypothetical protein PHX68_04445 [Alphaproteobacteria bacterium]|nr:hypothetical protein [Alphaproteobacteria bacterium]
MKKILLCCLLSLWACAGLAQTLTPEQALALAAHKPDEGSKASIYTGQPVIYMDKPQRPKRAAPEKPGIPTITIQPIFGKPVKADFVPQTTDWRAVVQVVDKDTLILDEKIQFINTDADFRLTRTLPKRAGESIEVINASIGSLPVVRHIRQTQSPDKLTAAYPAPLAPGIYAVRFTYRIKNAVAADGRLAHIGQSLTGFDWPQPITQFSALVLFPGATKVFENTLTFGANKVLIPQAFSANKDDRGNVAYTAARVLPAFADVQANITFDPSALPDAPLESRLLDSLDMLAFLVILLVLCGYMALYGWTELYPKPRGDMLRQLTRLHPLFLLQTAQGSLLKTDFGPLLAFYRKSKRRAYLTRAVAGLTRRRIARYAIQAVWSAATYLRFMYEIIIGEALILALGFWTAQVLGIAIPARLMGILIVIAVILNAAVYHFCVKTHAKARIQSWRQTLLNDSFCANLSAKSAGVFYPYVFVLTLGAAWIQSIRTRNKNAGAILSLIQ